MSTQPSLAYYTACVGQWRTPVAITITDATALATSGASWLDRVSLHVLARWPTWLGRVQMDTKVTVAGEVVTHSTDIRWLGVKLKRSVEHYALAPDGRRLTISGGMTGDGEIDETATRASYRLRWLGLDVVQDTVRDGDTVTVDQRGPGFRGVQVLRRWTREV